MFHSLLTEPDAHRLGALLDARTHDPGAHLGWHRAPEGWTLRVLQPIAESVSAETARGWRPMTRVADTPLFALRGDEPPQEHTRLRVSAGGTTHEIFDPYSFAPTIGADDLWLFNSGAAHQAHRSLGAHA